MSDWQDVGHDGWEDVEPSDRGVGKKLLGLGEAALNTASSLAAVIPSGISSLVGLASGDNAAGALERGQRSADAVTYEPRTEQGKHLSKGAQELLQRYQEEVANKFAGDQSFLNQKDFNKGGFTASGLEAENFERTLGEVVGSTFVPGIGAMPRKGMAKFAEKKGEPNMKGALDEALGGDKADFDKKSAAAQDSALMERLQAIQRQLEAEKNIAAEQPPTPGAMAFGDMSLRLRDPGEIPPRNNVAGDGNGMRSVVDGLERKGEEAGVNDMWQELKGEKATSPMDLANQAEAQKALEARQQAMEQEMAQKQSLDFNAAERARQEQAPVPGMEQERARLQQEEQAKQEQATQARQQAELEQARFTETQQGFGDLQAKIEQLRAQHEIEKRQAQMELDVKRQTTLEQGARDLNRQQSPEMTERLHQDQVPNMVADNPWVQKQEARLAKQEELIIKLSEQVQNGKAMPSQLAREMKNLKNFEEALSKTKENVEAGYRERKPALPFNFKKQGGGLLIDPGKEAQANALNKNAAFREKLGSFVPSHWTPEDVAKVATSMSDVKDNFMQKAIRQFTKGGLYEALKTNNPVIRFAYDMVSKADREARGDTQRYVHDQLAPATRAMSKKEKVGIWALMDQADHNKAALSEAILQKHGFSEAQINYWKTHTEVMGKAFEAINTARKAAGLDPISKREAYAAMRSTGSYRRLVYKLDEAGEKQVVGVIGSDYRAKVNKLQKEMEGKGYIVGEERYHGGIPRDRGAGQTALAHTLEVLSNKDPHVKDFLHTLDEIYASEAYSFLNAKTHTMNKKGVFGMEGRKDWESASKNAEDAMISQLRYAETAFKWGKLSEAAESLRPVLTNDKINMPNAKNWADYYLKNALGYNPSEVGMGLEKAVAAMFEPTGIGYGAVRRGVANTRKTINTILLSGNPGFWITQFVQPLRALPGMKALLDSKGAETRFDGGTGYSYLAEAGVTDWKERMGEKLSDVEKGALKYAHDNHVYGNDLIEHSTHTSKGVGYAFDKYANAVAGSAESSTRKGVYLALVHMMKDKLDPKDLYVTAHNLTDAAMNNYSPTERPRVYNTLGPIGDMAANLSSYKHNELSRIALFAREAINGKARPIATELMASVAFAGITGTIAFNEADWLVKKISTMLGKPTSLKLLAIQLSEDSGAGHVLSHGGFSLLGVDMSQRLGLNNIVGDTAADVLFPGASKLGDIAGAAATAATDPTAMNAKKLVREAAPNAASGMLDRMWFSKDTPQGEMGVNRKTLEAKEYRDDKDVFWKSMGMTGVHESVANTKDYEVRQINEAYKQLRSKPLQHAKEELFQYGKISPETIKDYLKYEGDINTLVTDIKQASWVQNVPVSKRLQLQTAMSKSITQLRAGQRMREVFGNENK